MTAIAHPKRLALLLSAALCVYGVVLAAPANAAVRCGGKRATKVGGPGDNTIRGTKGPDVIAGRGGNDTINGLGGKDIICGGPGGDLLFGGGGADRVLGGIGDSDLMSGDGGNDIINGGSGTLNIAYYGSSPVGVTVNLASAGPGSVGFAVGQGNDTISSVDAVIGSDSADAITGNDLSNTFISFAGNDTINGAGGVDGLDGGAGDDVLDGGADLDLVFYNDSAAGIVADMTLDQVTAQEGTDSLSNNEVVIGSQLNDVFLGNDETNYFSPQAGDDEMHGAGGFDMVMYFDSPSAITADLGAGTVTGAGVGNDSTDSIEGVFGSPLGDTITGGPGNDLILGDSGNDTIDGAAGDDLISAGLGDDDIDGGAGTRDMIDYELANAGVTVDLAAGASTGGEGNDSFVNIEEAFGSFYNDLIGGTPTGNNIWGFEGDDILRGFAGDDAFDGGGGADQLDAGDGTDQCGDDPLDTKTSCEGTDFPPAHPLSENADAAAKIRFH